MSALKGIAAGVLGLVALQAFGQAGASGRVGGAFSLLAQVVSRALDPKVPLIPDRRDPSSSKPLTDPTTATTPVARGAAGVVSGVVPTKYDNPREAPPSPIRGVPTKF